MMNSVFYTPATLIADIMKDNFRRQDSLALLGIKPGLDECVTVREACNAQGIDCDLLLHVCNVYTFEDYELEKNINGTYPLLPAMEYITRAHDFFLRVNAVDIRQNFEKTGFAFPEATRTVAVGLLDKFFGQIDEHISDINRIFDQYRHSPVSVIPGQVERIIGQEPKINETLDTLIRYLCGLPVPDKYKGEAEHQVCYLFQFLRKDIDMHEVIKNATLRRLIV